MDNSLDERVATAIISLDEDIRIKPSFDAVSYVNQRKSLGKIILYSFTVGPSSASSEVNSLRTNPWSELKRKNQILTSICQLVTKIAGDTVNESNVINVLEQFIADPNQSMRHMSRVWGEVVFFSNNFS